jgi:hypothetical protein
MVTYHRASFTGEVQGRQASHSLPQQDHRGCHLPEIHQVCWSMEAALEARDEEMMIRLIKIRGYMWT